MIHESLFSSRSEEYGTPIELYNQLNEEFHFTLDPCASKENAKCQKYFTKQEDGLKQSWDGERVFMNPPYGKNIKEWMIKASLSKALTVCLIHARTDTRWWWETVEKYSKEIRFIKGRLKFVGGKYSSTFPSVIVIFDNREEI